MVGVQRTGRTAGRYHEVTWVDWMCVSVRGVQEYCGRAHDTSIFLVFCYYY